MKARRIAQGRFELRELCGLPDARIVIKHRSDQIDTDIRDVDWFGPGFLTATIKLTWCDYDFTGEGLSEIEEEMGSCILRDNGKPRTCIMAFTSKFMTDGMFNTNPKADRTVIACDKITEITVTEPWPVLHNDMVLRRMLLTNLAAQVVEILNATGFDDNGFVQMKRILKGQVDVDEEQDTQYNHWNVLLRKMLCDVDYVL